MSDDEYEYEYDDDASMQEEEDQFEYTDEEEPANDAEVALENAYYHSKGLRETDINAAATAFENVITQEQERLASASDDKNNKKYGPWSYKAMKQLVKLHLRAGNAQAMIQNYHRLLQCIAQGDAVSPNQIEKGIHGMLERVASLYQGSSSSGASASGSNNNNNNNNNMIMDPQKIALQVYDATLTEFHPKTGSCQNERLWFKTNIKYGQLLYEMNETTKLQQVLHDLQIVHNNSTNNSNKNDSMKDSAGGGGTSSSSSSSSTQSMEIYALQIQLYSQLKDHKRLRYTFHKAMAVRGGLPHPRTLALIQELGGKMHMASKDYEEAGKTFFQAFKSYDEAGDASRLRCLKYLVLASMLHASTINPFDSQEARPYRDDVEIVAMTNLVQAFHNNDIQSFESILKNAKGRKLMEDAFIREHVQDLLRTIRTQVLGRLLIPYKRITLQALCTHLNDISVEDVEALVVRLIHNGSLHAKIDKTAGILIKMDPGTSSSMSTGGGGTSSNIAGSSTGGATAASGSSGASVSGGGPYSSSSGAAAEENALCDEMDQLANMLQDFSTQVTSMRLNKESSSSSSSGSGGAGIGPHMMGPGMSTMRSLVH